MLAQPSVDGGHIEVLRRQPHRIIFAEQHEKPVAEQVDAALELVDVRALPGVGIGKQLDQARFFPERRCWRECPWNNASWQPGRHQLDDFVVIASL